MPASDDLCFSGLIENARRLHTREIGAVELTRAFLARIDAQDGRTGA